MKCPECSKSNPASAKFCGSCGHKLEAAQKSGTSSGTSWDSVFKWIGIGVVGLFFLGILSGGF